MDKKTMKALVMQRMKMKILEEKKVYAQRKTATPNRFHSTTSVKYDFNRERASAPQGGGFSFMNDR